MTRVLLTGSLIGLALSVGWFTGYMHGLDDSEQVVHTTVWPCEIERGIGL